MSYIQSRNALHQVSIALEQAKEPFNLLVIPRVLVSLIFFFASIQAKSQHYHFSPLTVENGLSEGHVFDILQCRDGFLWIATRDGLNRFDGYNFKVFQQQNDQVHGISSNYVYTIFEDQEGILWLGTRNGLNRFDPKTEHFKAYTHDPQDPDSISHNTVWTVLEHGEQSLWVATNGGLNLFDKKSETFIAYKSDPDNPNALSHNMLRSIAKDDKGLWIASLGGGLSRMEFSQEGIFTKVPKHPDLRDRIRVVTIDPLGRLWVGSDRGLYLLKDAKLGEYQAIKFRNRSLGRITGLFVTDDLELLIASQTKGFFHVHLDNDEVHRFKSRRFHPNTPSSNSIRSVYQSRDGVIWLGNYGLGLDRSIPLPYLTDIHHTFEGEIWSILKDSSDTLWLGKNENGLERRRPNQEPEVINQINGIDLKREPVEDLLEDHLGNIWIGSQGAGLFQYKPSEDRYYRHSRSAENPKGATISRVTRLMEDQQKVLWVGSNRGTIERMVAPGVFESYQLQNGKGAINTRINAFSENMISGRRFLWVGAWSGLYSTPMNNPKSFTHYRHDHNDPSSISADTIFCMIAQGPFMWLGTTSGLNRFDTRTGEVKRYLVADGLPSNIIYTLLKGEANFLWLGTSKGISRFDTQSETFYNINNLDGLPNINIRLGAATAFTQKHHYYSGYGGFFGIDTSKVQLEKEGPLTRITKIKVDASTLTQDSIVEGQQNAGTTSLQLNHRNRSMEFEFVGLNFQSPLKNQYQYRLLPDSKEWISVEATQRRAVYTNLQAGNFEFQVKSSNKDGYWGPVQKVDISITPAPWKSPLAFLIYILLFGLIIARIVQSQSRKLERERRVSDRLRQLDALKDEFLANTSHELRTPLHGMIGMAEAMLDGSAGALQPKAQKNLRTIVKSGLRLMNLVNDILDFSKLKTNQFELHQEGVDLYSIVDLVLNLNRYQEGAENLEIRNDVPQDFPPVFADEARLRQILHNLVGNAIKFTQAGSVSVTATQKKGQALIRVVDTGIGISKEALRTIFNPFKQADSSDTRAFGGTGLGLAICNKLVGLHGGRLSATSEPGQGSTFTFGLPLHAEGLPKKDRSPRPDEAPERSLPAATSQTDVSTPSNQQTLEVLTQKVRPCILIVDDEEVNREVLLNQLSTQPYQTLQAANGPQALAHLRKHSVNLILLDIMMPQMSGIEVCKEVRKTWNPSELPIIFLTARNQIQDRILAFSVGGNDYISKPTEKAELLTRIETQITLQGLNRSLEDKVTERTQELKDTQSVLEESAYSAGRAEIATEVLHNVGNLLNSVRTSALIIEQALSGDHGNTLLTKIIENIEVLENGHFRFKSSDQRGDRLLHALEFISRHHEKLISQNLKESQRLGELIDRIVKVLRKQEHHLLVHEHNQAISLETLINQGLKFCKNQIAAASIQLELHNLDHQVILDAVRFRRIFMALMENALHAIEEQQKVDHRQGQIQILAANQGQEILLHIQDNGIGVPEALQKKIFAQGYSTWINKQGFGLHYCANALKGMGGQLELQSAGEGKGTTLTLHLPIQEQSQKQEALVKADG